MPVHWTTQKLYLPHSNYWSKSVKYNFKEVWDCISIKCIGWDIPGISFKDDKIITEESLYLGRGNTTVAYCWLGFDILHPIYRTQNPLSLLDVISKHRASNPWRQGCVTPKRYEVLYNLKKGNKNKKNW